MKKTDKLSRRQVMAIPTLINEKGMSIGDVAKKYKVNWTAIWYWIGRLREEGFKIRTRKKGQVKMDLKGRGAAHKTAK